MARTIIILIKLFQVIISNFTKLLKKLLILLFLEQKLSSSFQGTGREEQLNVKLPKVLLMSFFTSLNGNLITILVKFQILVKVGIELLRSYRPVETLVGITKFFSFLISILRFSVSRLTFIKGMLFKLFIKLLKSFLKVLITLVISSLIMGMVLFRILTTLSLSQTAVQRLLLTARVIRHI